MESLSRILHQFFAMTVFNHSRGPHPGKHASINMKLKINLLAVALCFGLLIGCESGCKTGQGRWEPSTQTYNTNAPADPVVVTAQNLRSQALNAFDFLWLAEMQFEKEAWNLSPKIKEYADYTRANSEKWLDDLTKAINTYQLARTPENKLKLDGVLKILETAIAESQKYTELAAKSKPSN